VTASIGIDEGEADRVTDGNRSSGQNILDRELDARFAKMELTFVKAQRTPWQVVWAAAGVCLLFIGGAYSIVIGPINTLNEKTESRFIRIEVAVASLTLQVTQVTAMQAATTHQIDQSILLNEAQRKDAITKDDLNRVIMDLNERLSRRMK
jgi:hypothetical protein